MSEKSKKKKKKTTVQGHQRTGIMKYIHKAWEYIKRFWKWYKGCFVGRPWYIKTLSTIASLIVFFFLYLGAVDVNLFWLFGKSPGFGEIKEHRTAQASELYSADGVLLGKYFNENRTPVEFEEVSPLFWRALIDTEDERFYDHPGIDVAAIFGAVKDAVTGRGGRGASTITQQLAKNMFRTRTKYSTGLLGNIPGLSILVVKSKEWILAFKLELYFSWTKGRRDGKNEILIQYANTVDFGHNSFGIKTASKTYFNTLPKDLTADQAAVLVGMLKATTYYNPISHPENAKERRNVVLSNMMAHGDLTKEQYDTLKTKNIDVSEFREEDNYDGQAKYFREAVAKYLKHLGNDANSPIENADLKEELADLDPYSDGLKIYTTLDTRMQKYAEEAVRKQMKQVQQSFNSHWSIQRSQKNFLPGMKPWQDENHQEIAGFIEDIAKKLPEYKHLDNKFKGNKDSIDFYLNKPHTVKLFDYTDGEIEREMSTLDSIRYMVTFMHCGFVAMEPQTGYVKAWVGDIDFDHWKYDKVTSMRQPGSTFKLFVYSAAMEAGHTPCTKVRDSYYSKMVFDKRQNKDVLWAPTNANGHFSGDSMPLRAAFAQSINSVAVKLGNENYLPEGIHSISTLAKDMGIQSPLDETPALPLGSSDVQLLELANAYCTVANNGKAHKEAILITKIVDRDGNTIYEANTEAKAVMRESSAWFMTQLLHAGMTDGGGTSQSLWSYVGNYPDTEFGGKTGTSNNHSDAWFMGVSKNLVVGAWVGGEYRSIHFRTGALGQGSRTALPVCGYFLQAVLGDPAFQKYHGKFDKPGDGINRADYECSYYASRSDTLNADSLDIEGGEIILDDDGNPVPTRHPEGNINDESPANKEQEGETYDF